MNKLNAKNRESERQRQLDWEKQRSQELQQQRQKEQERVLQLKAQNQSLGVELSQKVSLSYCNKILMIF
jgi:intersectin